MIAAPNKTGFSRLPLRAAIFVALACAAIIASTGWTEWASRDMEIRNAEVELGTGLPVLLFTRSNNKWPISLFTRRDPAYDPTYD